MCQLFYVIGKISEVFGESKVIHEFLTVGIGPPSLVPPFSRVNCIFFMTCAFRIVSKSHLQTQGYQYFLQFYVLGDLKFCVFYLQVYNLFWICFCEGCKVLWLSSFFYMWISSCYSITIDSKVCPFSVVLPFCSFAKDKLTIFAWIYFWALYSVPLIYLSREIYHAVLIIHSLIQIFIACLLIIPSLVSARNTEVSKTQFSDLEGRKNVYTNSLSRP